MVSQKSQKNTTEMGLVEARRIELRSMMNPWSGSTSLVDARILGLLGAATGVAAPSRFDLSFGHTGYVPKRIPLKMTSRPERGSIRG